jgi:hypothetical protein
VPPKRQKPSMEPVNRGSSINWPDISSALIVAHPGHEVRLHGWLEVARPRVFVFTDGSGHSGEPRLGRTTNYLASLGLEPGSLYGRYTDRAVYQRVLDQDFDFFIALVDELAEALSSLGVKVVAGDAAEGYNSIHDLCRFVVDASVAKLKRDGYDLESFDYAVVNKPDDCAPEMVEQALWLKLDDQTFSRKLSSARTYYPELLEEFFAAIGNGAGPMSQYFGLTGKGDGAGLEAFRVECLRPCAAAKASSNGSKPFYELHGERQAAAGRYDQVIRFHEHIAPIAERLRRHVK